MLQKYLEHEHNRCIYEQLLQLIGNERPMCRQYLGVKQIIKLAGGKLRGIAN